MICPKCGAPSADSSRFCSNCGTPVSVLSAPTSAPTAPAAPTYPPQVQQTSGKAIASLICGIINVFPLFIVAVILGHLSLSEIKKSGGRLKGQGLATAGLVLGYLGVVFIPIILIIAAIAIPNLLRARISANEASAVASVRNLMSAEVARSSASLDSGFSCNLSDLSGNIDAQLRTGKKHGYVFLLHNCTSEDSGPATRFQIVAVPEIVNTTGRRAFCSDESGMIKVDESGSGESCVSQGVPID